MREKIALWISQKRSLPYRFRKSLIKRACPQILTDYPFEINFYGIKYVGNTKDATDRLFFMFGGCDKYMLAFMRDYCLATNEKDFVFMDVGAHVGNHSLFMSKYAAKVHAFEPNQRVRETLNSHIYVNNIENIKVHPVGLSNKDEKIPFYASKDIQFSRASFRKDHDARNEYLEDLRVRVGDEIIEEKEIAVVDLIKVDVEGYEREVLEGLQNTIKRSRPAVIVEISETTRKSFGSRDDFESVFPEDYVFFQFSGVSREDEKYKVAPFDYDKHVSHLDVIAIPREKMIFVDSRKITDKVTKSRFVGVDNDR